MKTTIVIKSIFTTMAACLAGFLGGVLSSQPRGIAAELDVVRASRFELTNSTGTPLAVWEAGSDNGAHLRFFSRGGAVTLDISAAPGGMSRRSK